MNAISARVLKKDAAILGSICYIGLFATIILAGLVRILLVYLSI